MDEWYDCSSSGDASDTDEVNPQFDDDLNCTLPSFPKLQFRSDSSRAIWRSDLSLAELVDKKGKIWVSTGIVRSGTIFCFLEEILYLAEIGALILLDDNNAVISLEELYGKVAEKTNGCSWEHFESYRYLKSLGYVIGRHGVPWSVKGAEQDFDLVAAQQIELIVLEQMLDNLRVDELRPAFDVYLPNSKFKKSSPGDPAFRLCVLRGNPPCKIQIDALNRLCGSSPLKLCHVDHGRVSFFSSENVELPVLP